MRPSTPLETAQSAEKACKLISSVLPPPLPRNSTSRAQRAALTGMLAILSAASGFVAQPRGAAFAASRAAAVRHAGACLGASDNFYSFSAKELVSNANAPLSQYEGQVSLVVNVASK